MLKAVSLAMKLRSLCLACMAVEYEGIAERSGEEGWTPTRFLEYLCDMELAERSRRRTERLLKQSRLPPGKTLESLNQEVLPVKIRRQLPTIIEGDWVDRSENILAFGLPGVFYHDLSSGSEASVGEART